MRVQPKSEPQVIGDELVLIERIAKLRRARVVEIGCGGGALARRLCEAGATVVAVELPDIVPTDGSDNLIFRAGRAEALPLSDADRTLALMMKSLHHVPVARMDEALREVARVLTSGGTLIVCEPVAEGAFDAMIRPFHDERAVRKSAQAALDRCTVLTQQMDFRYLVPTRYADEEDFTRRMIESPTVESPVTAKARAIALALYAQHATVDCSFSEDRPFRCRVFKKL